MVVESGTADGQSWSMARRPPHRALAAHVGGYTGYVEEGRSAVRRREVPNGRVTLILSLGDELDLLPIVGVDRPVERLTSFVAGISDVHAVTEHAGRQRGIQVDLTPLGGSRLLGVPASALANAVVPLDGIAGRLADELTEQLACAADWPSRFALLDTTLLRLMDAGPEVDPAIRWAWDQLDRSDGQVLVGTLADEIGWSRRHFAARFRADIGLAPKATGRVLRFRRAVDLLTAGAYPSIGQVAAACGFADHSHLVRDFRSLAGCTPSELLAERTSDGLAEATTT
jgi:AraC-like DNA-binding protein